MMQGLFSARLGLTAQQRRVDTLANNVANTNTIGFKADNIRFKEALAVTMQRPLQPQAGYDLQLGTGVLVASQSRNRTQGPLVQTGQALDFCLLGEGFFALEENGTIQYTRDGRFGVGQQADGRYLMTAQGSFVLDENMQRISLLAADQDLTADNRGVLSTPDNPHLARLGLVSFDQVDGLESAGHNCFVPTAASGPAHPVETEIRQGCLEQSNVDLAREMTRLIRSQRCFSLASRAITTLDDMQGATNNLRT